jgi:hypothetical protein
MPGDNGAAPGAQGAHSFAAASGCNRLEAIMVQLGCRQFWLGLVAASVLCAAAGDALASDQDNSDAFQVIRCTRYGLTVQAPRGWRLVEQQRHQRAFVLQLPTENNRPSGMVACELGVAPAALVEFQQRYAAADAQQPADARRVLTHNAISRVDPERFGLEQAERLGEQLTAVWEYDDPQRGRLYEMRVQLISHDTLYTFVLHAGQDHWEAYRLDFLDMIASAQFTAPETGLRRLPDGFWMQRDFRFALRLPPGWQPAFAPHDNVLLFATGAKHAVFTDNLLVLASPRAALDLQGLHDLLPRQVARDDPQARVECRVVQQGDGEALETLIHTQRGGFALTILERRFQGRERNYEVKFTCETEEFRKIETELRRALDSFREVVAADQAGT